jgi:hypothetical protein
MAASVECIPAASPDVAPPAYATTLASDSTEDDDPSKLKAPRPYLEIQTSEDENSFSSDNLSLPQHKISLDLTPLSCKSTDSDANYRDPDQTIIIFDWDDTLCPSTTCMRTHGLSVLGERPTGELAASLEALAAEAQALIERACELAAKVVVVTNAEDGWVDLSCKAWMPNLRNTLSTCEVCSARSTYESKGVASPAGWKARAFENVIERFYSQYQNQSWKNILSVGDAPHEREALSRVVRWAPTGKKCRSKSVKFILRPTIQQLTRELQMLRDSLKEIIDHNDDLDLHFSAESLADDLSTSPSASI